MISYKVGNEFAELKEFTVNLPHTFDRMGLVIENKRNVVKKVITSQGTFVIKYFKGMYFFNRLAYSFFRKSKAVRSYIYSRVLNDKGIVTPAPVAWINCYNLGLLTDSYFVSVYCPHKTLREVMESFKKGDDRCKVQLLRELAAFCVRMHMTGAYHDDFSVGNILVDQTENGYEFALVDLNRVKFQDVSYACGLRSFAKLNLPAEDLNVLIKEYAILSGESSRASADLFWKHKKQASALRRIRKKIRYYTLKPIQEVLYRRFA
jgi:tRNA A-37 threonylcarbamoyl transferase component Bud32